MPIVSILTFFATVIFIVLVGLFIYLTFYNRRTKTTTDRFIEQANKLKPTVFQNIKIRYWTTSGLKTYVYSNNFCDLYLFDNCLAIIRRQDFIFKVFFNPILLTSDTTTTKILFNYLDTYKPDNIIFKQPVKGEANTATLVALSEKEIKLLISNATYKKRLKSIEGLELLQDNDVYFIKYKDELINIGSKKRAANQLDDILKKGGANVEKEFAERVAWKKKLDNLEIARKVNPDKYWRELVYTDIFPPPAPPKKPCFLANTLIGLNSYVRSIKEAKVGDTTIAYDLENNCQVPEAKITAVYKNMAEAYVRIVTLDFHYIHCTGQHLFWIDTEKRWVKAIDMKPGMPLFDTSRHTARKSKVRRVVIVNKPVETYNIEVEKYHNYFISNNTKCILTHNASKNSSFVSTKKFNYNIYKILDPDDDVIYVGQTIQTIEERLKQHRKDKRKVKWVSLMKEVDWLIEKVEMTNYEAAVWETYHIGENGGLSKMNKNTLLKNKQIPIGKKKFEKFQKLGTFNPCKLLI